MRSIPPGCLSWRFLLHFLFQNLYMHITKLVFLSLLVCVQGMRHFPRQSYGCIRKSVLKLRVKQKKKVSAFWVLLMIESSFNMWQFHLHSSATSSKAKFLAIDFFFLMKDDYLKGKKNIMEIWVSVVENRSNWTPQAVASLKTLIFKPEWRCVTRLLTQTLI